VFQTLPAPPEPSLIVTLNPLLQHFNVPSQIAVVASVSCQTCVATHESIQMPWSIHRLKEKVPNRPVLRAPIPTPPVKIWHPRVVQEGEPDSHGGAYPVVGVPALPLDRALRTILMWKWPKKTETSSAFSPSDPARSAHSHLLVLLPFSMWDLSTRPSNRTIVAIARWRVCHPASAPCHHHPIFSAANRSRTTRSDGCILVRSFSPPHSYSLKTHVLCISFASSHDDC